MSKVVENRGPDTKTWRLVFLTALVFGLVAFVVVDRMRHSGYIAAVWPANGVLLAAIMASQRRYIPAFLITALLANVIADMANGQSLPIAFYLSACSSVEMLTAIALMRRYRPGDWIRLEEPGVLAGFWLTVCLAAPLASAALASIGLHYFVAVPAMEVFTTWWVANALGLAVVTPPVLILSRDGASACLAAIGNKRALASLLLLIVVTLFVFSQTRYPLMFLVFPPMVLVAFHAGFLGVAIGLILVTLESITMTVMGTGPLTLIAEMTQREITIMAQLFLAAMMFMGFPVAASLSQRRKLEQRLEILATTDALTGLATRRRFEEHYRAVWAGALREGKSIAIMMLDIDSFKPYNDSYGHLQGDQCIKQVAEIIRAIARRPLDLAVRYGGEEFLLLLPHASIEGALALSVEVHQALAAAEIPHRDSPFGKITLSIGLAIALPEPGMASVDLIEAADKTLYRAKHNGRARTEITEIGLSPAQTQTQT